MSARDGSVIDELTPLEAHAVLAEDHDSTLIDVRTHAERAFTGVPDLAALGKEPVAVEWISFPSMAPNPRFLDEVLARVGAGAGGRLPARLLFICRSGGRSMAAARAVAAASAARGEPVQCTNVAGGFEGDLDDRHHRGTRNGWKADGLPWRQS